jgi:hypothetical protein
MLDAQFVTDSESASDLLLQIFRFAQNDFRPVIPVASPRDLTSNLAYGQILARDETRLAVRLEAGAIEAEEVKQCLRSVKVEFSDCVAIVDFAMLDLSIEGSSTIVARVLEEVDALGSWQRLIFQGSGYPPANPSAAGASAMVPRSEFIAFKEAAEDCAVDPARLIFGDYGADTGRIRFSKKAGGKTIRHLRYTTPDAWLVVRGEDRGTFEAQMAWVASQIVENDAFAGRAFSAADEQIFRISRKLCGPGNATT